jgi:hypothetical protein
MQTIKHKFHDNPIPTRECKTLILGTFNPEKGSNTDYYYGRLRQTGGWSNRFWPAVNSYLEANTPEIPIAIKGDVNSKVRIMSEFKFGCIDLISQVDCENEKNITGNGFPDSAIFSSLNKRYYNTSFIIDFINGNKVNKIISSFGKGTSLNKEARNEIEKIRLSCSNSVFHLFDLPAFGRPLMSTERFGKELFQYIL